MRCYILQRPPVSNMFETVIYVPWVAGCASLIFPSFRRQPLALLAACTASVILLLIVEVTGLNQTLDQVQAVLDSQFWLMIHVLLVVGSYGIFILGAVLGHLYLLLFIKRGKEAKLMPLLSSLILQTMYGGTALLVTGTILGGIWAAESWGRFWDWDPKESVGVYLELLLPYMDPCLPFQPHRTLRTCDRICQRFIGHQLHLVRGQLYPGDRFA